MDAAGLSGRCRFHRKTVDEIDFPPGTFDLVTSISALEHIPDGGTGERSNGFGFLSGRVAAF